MFSKTQKQLKTLSANLLNNQQAPKTIQQEWNKPCETCKDTETGISLGVVYWNDIGASGVEKFTLSDCPTCNGEKIVWSKNQQ